LGQRQFKLHQREREAAPSQAQDKHFGG